MKPPYPEPIQLNIEYIIDYFIKHKKLPISKYKDREILLTVATLNIQNHELHKEAKEQIIQLFEQKPKSHYASTDYLNHQLAIINKIHNLDILISDVDLRTWPPKQAHIILLSGFLQYNKFLKPLYIHTPPTPSDRTIFEFMCFINEHYDFIKHHHSQHKEGICAIETFEAELLQTELLYTTNDTLFRIACSKLVPDTYPINNNIHIVLNTYLHTLHSKEEPLVLLEQVFKESSVIQDVLVPLRTMINLNMNPFYLLSMLPYDYMSTSLVVKAFESLQIVQPIELPEFY